MNSKQKNWLLVGPVIFSFMMAMTTPIIQVYFIRLVNPNVLAVSNMLAVGLAAVVNTSITKERFLRWYDKHFTFIIVTDILLFVVVSCAGMEMAAARYIGMAITIQCLANLFMGLTDLRARKLLIRSDDNDNRRRSSKNVTRAV